MSERRQIAWINPISALGALILLADVVMIVVSLQSDQRDEVLSAPNENIPEAEYTAGGAIEPSEGANGIATFTPPPLTESDRLPRNRTVASVVLPERAAEATVVTSEPAEAPAPTILERITDNSRLIATAFQKRAEQAQEESERAEREGRSAEAAQARETSERARREAERVRRITEGEIPADVPPGGDTDPGADTNGPSQRPEDLPDGGQAPR